MAGSRRHGVHQLTTMTMAARLRGQRERPKKANARAGEHAAEGWAARSNADTSVRFDRQAGTQKGCDLGRAALELHSGRRVHLRLGRVVLAEAMARSAATRAVITPQYKARGRGGNCATTTGTGRHGTPVTRELRAGRRGGRWW